jgi:hydrogenase maturation protease
VNPRVPVFLCGEASRGDDGAALRAIRLVAPDVRRHARVVPARELDAKMLRDLPADTPCVIVDAVPGIPAGEIVTKPLQGMSGRGRRPAGRARWGKRRPAQEPPLEQTLASAAELRGEPIDGWFLGIGVTDCEPGETLSPAVAVALPTVAAKLAALIEALAHPDDESD